MTKVAFIGLGTMGSGMAARLMAAGFPLTVYNRTRGAAEVLQSQGASLGDSPRKAAGGADVVIAMVADDGASRQVWTGPDGALQSVCPGSLLIDCSTITAGWARELAGLAQSRGCLFLDAPVTGSRPQAHSGELLFLVGGPVEAMERARPVFRPMSRSAIHMGGNGAGATMKLINNFVCGVQAAALAEAMAWVERSGLDAHEAVSVLAAGAPGSPLVKALAGRMSNQAYDVNFRLELMAKDLDYAGREAQSSGVDLTTARAALGRFQTAIEKGFGGCDFSAVVEPLRGKTQ